MSSTITIRAATGTWSVRSSGAVLGETDNALELIEDGHAPVIYFPREDIAMAFLDPSDKRTTCSKKGEATYYTIVNRSASVVDSAWSYESPNPDAARIAGYIAFDTSGPVAVEQL